MGALVLVMHGKAWHGWVQWCFFLPFVSLLFEACCLYPYPTHSGHLAGILDIPEQVAVCFLQHCRIVVFLMTSALLRFAFFSPMNEMSRWLEMELMLYLFYG